jgi:hypothetical protein
MQNERDDGWPKERVIAYLIFSFGAVPKFTSHVGQKAYSPRCLMMHTLQTGDEGRKPITTSKKSCACMCVYVCVCVRVQESVYERMCRKES